MSNNTVLFNEFDKLITCKFDGSDSKNAASRLKNIVNLLPQATAFYRADMGSVIPGPDSGFNLN